jgi:protein-S-isoprenylcysteine O-methyltransferase Ste14
MAWNVIALIGVWILLGVVFFVPYTRSIRTRTAKARRAPVAMLGMGLEGAALGLIFAFNDLTHVRPLWLVALGLILALASVWLAEAALRVLGRQWRLQAVVTEDHELVREGPYSAVRHPIYLAMFGMTLASGMLVSRPLAVLAGVVLYVVGTEIRIRAEDLLLEERFGEEFRAWRAHTKAWLPPLR